jgi:flagellar biosynthesis GTPase FlhF
MDSKLTKSLTDLIDETLQELDELRKSRFAAAEIKIEGPGDGIDGKPSNGDLEAKKAEDKEKEEKEQEDEKAEEKAEKSECMDKKEDKDEEKDEEHPSKEETKEKAKDIEEDAKEIKKLHKSIEESESLMKSYVEERVRPLEDKLSTILDLVNKIADQPVAPKGATFKAAPLMKSEDAGVEPLSKAQVASKLFELKKSGTRVDSLDIAKAEMGQDLKTLIKKYEIS